MYNRSDIIAEIERRANRSRYNHISTIFPDEGKLSLDNYPKHKEFFEAGNDYRFRFFVAGNRVGKTYAGCYELSLHLTGLYPQNWIGKRFDRPVNTWAIGETVDSTKEALQYSLIGNIDDWGSGLIPKECIIPRNNQPGSFSKADSLAIVKVKHFNCYGHEDGVSELAFKSYDQGYKRLEGSTKDIILLDEQPPLSVFSTCRKRVATTKGDIMVTFTPLAGRTDLYNYAETNDTIHMTTASLYDAAHFSKEEVEAEIRAEHPQFVDCKIFGIPGIGEGSIYPFNKDDIGCDPFNIPKEWPKFVGYDPCHVMTEGTCGIIHSAYDKDSDTVYIYASKKLSNASFETTLEYFNGLNVKEGVWDSAMEKAMKVKWRSKGYDFSNANKNISTGIYEVWSRMETGRLKIFNTCNELWNEIINYIRGANGKIKKSNDHLMDAMRYSIMSDPKKWKMNITEQVKTKKYSGYSSKI